MSLFEICCTHTPKKIKTDCKYEINISFPRSIFGGGLIFLLFIFCFEEKKKQNKCMDGMKARVSPLRASYNLV